MKTKKRIDFIEENVRQAKDKFFEKNVAVADIATDHGYIAEKLSKQNYVEKVYATDISEKSLTKLEKLIKFHRLLNIFAFLGDGLDPIDKVDIAVIAGIGGLEIIKMLCYQNKTKEGKRKCDVFVLSPSQNLIELRRFIFEKDYFVLSDLVVEDAGRFYSVIVINVAKKMKTRKTIFNLWLGRDNKIGSPDFKKFLDVCGDWLTFLDDIPLERVRADETLFQKYKLKKLIEKLQK